MPDAPPILLADAWNRLRQGRARADHPFRIAALATADAAGMADVRTVVLRRVDPLRRLIDFQTDRRSPKFAALQHNAAAAWLFYDGADWLQLRLQTSTTLHTDDDVADAEWAAVPLAARASYRSPLTPGATIDGPDVPAPHDGDGDGRAQFSVVRCRVASLEWLRREAGVWHRIRFTWPDGEAHWQWLVP
ncbi:MAG TPA: pyridoxamine 5'-phosphate oxidase family protein [Tepidisphaeraceae bacterium]|jgi:hypothetical protein